MNKSTKLLIVEDNESLLLLMNHYFGKTYEVYASKNGLEAMNLLTSGMYPDLIILDWDLPIMSGSTFLEGIQSSSFFSSIPIIVISGSINQLDTSRFSGIKHFYKKPFDPVKLNHQIQETLSLKIINSKTFP